MSESTEITVVALGWLGVACLFSGALMLGSWLVWFTVTTHGVDIAAFGLMAAGVLFVLPALIYIWRAEE